MLIVAFEKVINKIVMINLKFFISDSLSSYEILFL